MGRAKKNVMFSEGGGTDEKKYNRSGEWLTEEEAKEFDEDKDFKEREYRREAEYRKKHPLTAPGHKWVDKDIERRLKEYKDRNKK